jgi:hypothetical protein
MRRASAGWLHGEHVVRARIDDQRGGIGLGVHRIHGHHHVFQVECLQESSHGRDLVALRRRGELSDDDAARVVERGDQVRGGHVLRAGATGGLPVDGDHPAAVHERGAGPHERADQRVQHGCVQTGHDSPEPRLVRCARSCQPEPGQVTWVAACQLGSPLRDRGRSWRAVLTVALIGGLLGTVALGGLAGARRTASAYGRYLASTNASDVFVDIPGPSLPPIPRRVGEPSPDLSRNSA